MMDNGLDQNYLKTLTVLFVEDDDITREQFSEYLRRLVGRLITAVNGAEGLEAFIKNAPDIVITDIHMPLMDGLTMSCEIKGRAPHIPIIVITAFEQTDYLMRAIDLGVHKYVTKPVNSDRMLQCLLECAHCLRADEQLKLEHQREIQALQFKQHEAVATLAGGLAHDYNNLLHSILGFFTLAKNKLEALDEGEGYLDYITEWYSYAGSLNCMLEIISSKSSSRSKYAIKVLPYIQFTLEKALADTAITLVKDYAVDLPATSFVIVKHMHLLFTTLADNAVEAMPTGGTLTLAASTTPINENDLPPLVPGNYLHFSLSDTGCGIHPDILPRIFEPYFSTKQRGSRKGIGLSLAMCQTIIMNHGGIITAESTLGNGAVFHIWLPIIE